MMQGMTSMKLDPSAADALYGTDVSFGTVAAGTILPISAMRINSSGTLATGLVLLF